MPGEVVQAAQIIAGSGAAGWLADKLLGPSAQALGEQIKAYAGDRLRKIFHRVNEKIDLASANTLPPGFAINFIQKASFSEDDEDLTEMWANLLSNAARNFDSRQTAYVEILSQMSAADARVLDVIIPEAKAREIGSIRSVNGKIELKVSLAKQITNISKDEAAGQEELTRLLTMDIGWPARVNSARVYFENNGENRCITGGKEDQSAEQDNLVRLGLLERFEISNTLTPLDVGFEGVMATMLGIGFVQACRGHQ